MFLTTTKTKGESGKETGRKEWVVQGRVVDNSGSDLVGAGDKNS